MNKLMITVAALMTAFFPKSEKAISEKLQIDELNAFGGELTELGERVNAQREGNEKLVADLKLANEANVAHAAKVVELETTVKSLGEQLAVAEKDRATYKEWFDKSANAGKRRMAQDLGMSDREGDPDDYTKMAYDEAQRKLANGAVSK